MAEKRKKSIFNWNHISSNLTDKQIKELKSYYSTYYRKAWAYKQAMKKFKRLKLIGNSLSIVFASGGIVSSIVTHGTSLVAISTTALLIQSWMKHKNLDLKIQNCTYAYQMYSNLAIDLKGMLRSGEYKTSELYNKMCDIDHFITDTCPHVDKYLYKYDQIFTD